MSAEHRKPVVAFVVLAFLAAVLVGTQRADARGGQFFAAVAGASARVHGVLPTLAIASTVAARQDIEALGPVFVAVADARAASAALLAAVPKVHPEVSGRPARRAPVAVGKPGDAAHPAVTGVHRPARGPRPGAHETHPRHALEPVGGARPQAVLPGVHTPGARAFGKGRSHHSRSVARKKILEAPRHWSGKMKARHHH